MLIFVEIELLGYMCRTLMHERNVLDSDKYLKAYNSFYIKNILVPLLISLGDKMWIGWKEICKNTI